MSFKIITIARTSEGREIPREKLVPGDEISVGRLSENDVHLADLAVEPRHAVIKETSPGRVTVDSISGLGFGFEDFNVQAGLGEHDSGGESVGSRADYIRARGVLACHSSFMVSQLDPATAAAIRRQQSGRQEGSSAPAHKDR